MIFQVYRLTGYMDLQLNWTERIRHNNNSNHKHNHNLTTIIEFSETAKKRMDLGQALSRREY